MKLALGGYGPAGTLIDTEHHVIITDAFAGPIFRTHDGVCLSVFMRDDGYEFNCWQGDADPDMPLPSGAIMGAISMRGVRQTNGSAMRASVNHEPEAPLLGYATNRQLVEELAARYALGSTQAGYRTIDGGNYPIDPDSALNDPLEAPTAPEHRDPMWEVPDEPWAPDQTKCYTCDGVGSINTDTCDACKGTGLADPPGDQLMTAVFQAIGSASMCWEHVDRAGVFHSERAKWVGDGLLAWIQDHLNERPNP